MATGVKVKNEPARQGRVLPDSTVQRRKAKPPKGTVEPAPGWSSKKVTKP